MKGHGRGVEWNLHVIPALARVKASLEFTMTWPRTVRHLVYRVGLTGLLIAALSLAASAFRHHIEDRALAAIEASERASLADQPTLRVHVEFPVETESAASERAFESVDGTRLIVLPVVQPRCVLPFQAKPAITPTPGSQEI